MIDMQIKFHCYTLLMFDSYTEDFTDSCQVDSGNTDVFFKYV